jgi:hypothetical protein
LAKLACVVVEVAAEVGGVVVAEVAEVAEVVVVVVVVGTGDAVVIGVAATGEEVVMVVMVAAAVVQDGAPPLPRHPRCPQLGTPPLH